MTGSGGPFRHMIQPPQLDENNRHCFLCIPCTIDYLTFRLFVTVQNKSSVQQVWSIVVLLKWQKDTQLLVGQAEVLLHRL